MAETTRRVKHALEPSERVRVTNLLPSLAKQSFAKECDINNIMGKFRKTGLLEHTNRYQGQYGDLPLSIDYHEAMNQVIAADIAFMSLPAYIRNTFDNDPAAFLGFVSDPENEEEMIAMGLKKGEVKQTPDTTPPVVISEEGAPVPDPGPPEAV